MFSQNSFIRNLKRNRLHTFINLTGLSLSFAVVILLSAYIISEWQVNRIIPGVDNIYLLVRENQSALIPEDLLEKLRNEVPGIKDATMWNSYEREFTDQRIKGKILATDTSFLRIFDIQLLSGNLSKFDEGGYMIVASGFTSVTEKNALTPAGEYSGYSIYNPVIGIVSNASSTKSIPYDIIVPRSQSLDNKTQYFEERGGIHLFPCAVLLDKGINSLNVESRINTLMEPYAEMNNHHVNLVPFKEVYFDSTLNDDYSRHANTAMVKLMVFVTLAILLLSLLNYINLTSARNLFRTKEVGIRKTLGAGHRSVFSQFMIETYQLSFIAVILAFFIALLAKPYFETILGQPINLNILYENAGIVLQVIGVFLVIGWLAGVAPALSVVRISPVSLMGKQKTGTSGYSVRQLLTVVQFTVSIALIFSLFIVYRQVDFVKHKSLGFDSELLLKIDSRDLRQKQAFTIKEKLLTYTGISNVSITYGSPGDILVKGSSEGAGRMEFAHIFTDTDFIQTFGIQLIKGNNITDDIKDGFIINEKEYTELGKGRLDSLETGMYPVCGVIKDFHVEGFHNSMVKVRISPIQSISRPTINIRLSGNDIASSMEFIKNTLESFGLDIYEYAFYDDYFDSLYKQEENQAKAIRVFTLVALLISCLGLFGLAEFYTRNKIKEIGIRRVNGALASEIMFLLNRNFLTPVIIAFAVACPVGWYFMDEWLENFAYKTELSWWVFALAGLVALGIALLTVSFQSWKAATRNPVEALRYE